MGINNVCVCFLHYKTIAWPLLATKKETEVFSCGGKLASAKSVHGVLEKYIHPCFFVLNPCLTYIILPYSHCKLRNQGQDSQWKQGGCGDT